MRVVVIGGGPAGVSAALHAAELGVEVTLIEREDRLRAGRAAALVGLEGRRGRFGLSAAFDALGGPAAADDDARPAEGHHRWRLLAAQAW